MDIINSLQDKIYLSIENAGFSKSFVLVRSENILFNKNNILADCNVYEEKFYNININISFKFDTAWIIIGDKENIEIKYNNNKEIKMKKRNIFNCLYGFNNITVMVRIGEQIVYYISEYFSVLTNKVSALYIEKMVNSIFNFDDNLLNCVFSNKYFVNKSNTKKINIELALQFIESVCDYFKTEIYKFKENPKSKIIKTNDIVNLNELKFISNKSFRWIFENPTYLKEVRQDTNIKYNSKNYIPTKVLSENNSVSYDCYENQVILSFIGEMRRYIIKIADNTINTNSYKLTKSYGEYINVDSILQEYIEEKKSNLKNRVKSLETSLDQIYNVYRKLFKCSEINMIKKPVFTDTFRQLPHYRKCFSLIDELYSYINFNEYSYNYILSIISLDRMFELFCLIKILNAYLANGFILNMKETLNSESEIVYILAKDNIEVDILYQVKISSKDDTDMINLKRRSNGFYIPDFVIRYKNITNNKFVYSIFDSKFSNLNNVKEYYLRDICYKYYMDIYSENKSIPPIINIGLFSLLGKNNEGNWQIDNKKNKALPKVNIVSISLDDNFEDINKYINEINEIAYEYIL